MNDTVKRKDIDWVSKLFGGITVWWAGLVGLHFSSLDWWAGLVGSSFRQNLKRDRLMSVRTGNVSNETFPKRIPTRNSTMNGRKSL
mgnify:CR=1 FL=1